MTDQSATPSPDQRPPTSYGGWSDRVLGLIVVLIAIWYTVESRTYTGTGFGSGPVGPKTLPTGLGVLFGIFGLYLLIRPDDERPEWPNAAAGWRILVVLGTSFLYGQLLRPVGFIFASALMIIVIGALFKAPWKSLIPLSIAFPTAVAYSFNTWLGLKLPDGWWGGIPSNLWGLI